MIKLSICIPTYNRASYLQETLENVFSFKEASLPQVEVVVCDNNSPDNTQEVLAEFAEKYSNLRCFKNPQNIGFDGNMTEVFNQARGEYCLVLGDDDAFTNGAIARLLEDIKSGLDLYIYYMRIYDIKMRFMEPLRYLKNVPDGAVIDMADKKQVINYLNNVRSNAGLFGHIGQFMVRRDLWQKVPYNETVTGLNWIHIYKLWYLRKFKSKFKFSSFELLNIRAENDTIIRQSGICARLLMEVNALYIIGGIVFDDDSDIFNAFLDVIKRYSPLYTIPPLFAVAKKDRETFYKLVGCLHLYPYTPAQKAAISCSCRISPLYFLRIILNKPAFKYFKKPVKFIKDLL